MKQLFYKKMYFDRKLTNMGLVESKILKAREPNSHY